MIAPLDTRAVLALRSQILERSQTLGPGKAAGAGFDAALGDALKSVSRVQAEASNRAAAYERGDTDDLAGVMIARQKASIAFEATLQVRNRLLGAYKDIMSMPL